MAGLGIEPRNNKRGEVKHLPRQVTTNKHRVIVGDGSSTPPLMRMPNARMVKCKAHVRLNTD